MLSTKVIYAIEVLAESQHAKPNRNGKRVVGRNEIEKQCGYGRYGQFQCIEIKTMKKLFTVALFCFGLSAGAFAQKFAMKTNLLYDATSTMNLGGEIGLAPKWTLDISGNYNPWTFSDNRKMKHWLIQPEVRWWTCQKFSGHFFGLHGHYAQYNMGGMLPWGFETGKMFGNISNDAMLNHRYEGWLAGGGISYGYHWILGNRWSLEATVGVGYAYLKYDKYSCAKCGQKIGSESKHYVGPTKAGIALIYMIK